MEGMDGRMGGGVVRHEYGAKATWRGTERESRRRRHERGFRPRGMLRVHPIAMPWSGGYVCKRG